MEIDGRCSISVSVVTFFFFKKKKKNENFPNLKKKKNNFTFLVTTVNGGGKYLKLSRNMQSLKMVVTLPLTTLRLFRLVEEIKWKRSGWLVEFNSYFRFSV